MISKSSKTKKPNKAMQYIHLQYKGTITVPFPKGCLKRPFFKKKKKLFIYLFYFWLCWVFFAVRRLSLVAASGDYSSLQCVGFSLRRLLLLRSTSSRRAGFSSCGARAYLLHGMWSLPGPGLEPVSPALAGRFLTTVPPGKSLKRPFKIAPFTYIINSVNRPDLKCSLNCLPLKN